MSAVLDADMRPASSAMQMPASDVIDVAFGVDKNYIVHVAAVIASVMHYAPDARFRFIILHIDVDTAMQARIEAMAPGAVFVWAEVGDDDLPPFADRGHFSRATLFRLGLEKLAPADCGRVLYLDADITVVSDVRPLLRVDLGANVMGAVHDPNVDAAAFGERWGLGAGHYFNAGILLIDLERVRAERLFSKAADFVAKHDRDLPWNDQDALNWSCWGRWLKLDPAWNAQRAMAIPSHDEPLSDAMKLRSRPRIIHFTGGDKPWIAGAYHPWSWLYWESVARTPFAAEIAAKQGVGALARFKMWLRFLRRWRWLSARP
ncbi:MAG: glycosyltransferase family 8 protein [Terricaulis sp.]